MVRPLSASDLDSAHAAAQRVVETHRALVEFLKVGQTLAEIDAFVGRTLEKLNCTSCFLGYKQGRSPAFPSYACLSLNECVVHGTAGYLTKPMEAGDVLSIDIGVKHHGWIGDAAWTYAFQTQNETAKRLMACGQESLRRGIEQLQPGRPFLEFAKAVQQHVEVECGFHCVRGLGGHGYGRKLHTPPYVANNVPSYPGEWPDAFTPCKPGMLLAIEPKVAVGTGEIRQRSREWPVFTADNSLSVHYEHDVYISESGPKVLTEGLDDLPAIVG
ncbi:MAG: type I methionyl aminopeptidase [Planctomycetota bacterium]|nr:type I methionyl aminopeptidase [Planctomycetota bacterium]